MGMKLYGLYVVDDEASNMSLVAASNEIDKLQAVTIHKSNSTSVCNDPNNKYLRRKTPDNVYPQFYVYEIPYIV